MDTIVTVRSDGRDDQTAYLHTIRRYSALLIVAAGLVAGYLWTVWTDTRKAQNPLSAVLMSGQPAQRLHDFGALPQRLHLLPVIWHAIISIL